MRIGGVPEHYNAPVEKLCLQDRSDAKWITYPSGTGAMLEALDNGELDMAIVLTEGVVKHSLSNSSPPSVRILGTYLDNPLPWGVHVRVDGGLKSLSDVNQKMSHLTFGVSRMGSGSHLMAIVHASTLPNAPLPKLKVVNTMAGARDAMVKGEIDVFLWDVTTADIYTREGAWTCVGTVSGDWPAFVFAVRSNVSPSMLEKLVSFIDDLRTECRNMTRDIDAAVEYLKIKFSLSEDQARHFLKIVKWNSSLEVEQKSINRVVTALVSAGIIANPEHDSSVVVPGKCRLV